MERQFSRFAGDCHVWVGEMPAWARLQPIGRVETYWRWRSSPPASAMPGTAGWGLRVGFGGSGAHGVLGATFVPHEYPYLRVVVTVTSEATQPAAGPFHAARVGLLHEYAGAVLAGSLQEADNVGPGTLTYNWGAVHTVDSSWETFRVLSVGVTRLAALPPGTTEVPAGLLPYFGGDTPKSPGAD